jgi:hypothetical protein
MGYYWVIRFNPLGFGSEAPAQNGFCRSLSSLNALFFILKEPASYNIQHPQFADIRIDLISIGADMPQSTYALYLQTVYLLRYARSISKERVYFN